MKVFTFASLVYMFLGLTACRMNNSSVNSKEQNGRNSTKIRIEEYIGGVLNFLEASQVKKTVEEYKLKGEWGSQMLYRKQSLLVDAFTLGVGTEAYDSSCFETASTAIILADIYIKYHTADTERTSKILPMLDSAMEKVMTCKEETGGFAFWPHITMPEKWTLAFPKGSIPSRIRGPKNFPYTKYFVQLQNSNFADADDTALSYLALLKYDDIMRNIVGKTSIYSSFLEAKIGPEYDKYRHKMDGDDARFAYKGAVGSFLVWWGKRSSIPLAIGDTKPVMPMNINVIDCVVNANALGVLSLKKEDLTTQGYQSSCRHVNEVVQNKLDKECGLYYPSPYTLHYAVAKALHNGATCLEPSRITLQQDIVNSQRPDGSWTPFEKDEKDAVQTTMIALSALLKLAPPEFLQSSQVKEKIYLSINYLLANHSGGQNEAIHWKPGIYFSAGPALFDKDGLRGVVVWKSIGFTNAIMLDILYAIKDIYKDDLNSK